MAAKRTSVYLVDSTLALAAGFDSLSGRLNTICGRYDVLVEAAMPEFAGAEWCAIFDANNGTILSFDYDRDEPGTFTGVWANVADSDGLDKKWKIDQRKLVERMRRLGPAQQIAVMEAIQTFFAHHERPTDEALAIATRRKPLPPASSGEEAT